MANIKQGVAILDRAKRHLKGEPTKIITVPEWPDDDGEPTKIYARPLTLNERNRIFAAAKQGDLAMFAEAIILKATDENGQRLFSPAHKHTMMREIDANVLETIGQKIMGDKPTEVDSTEADDGDQAEALAGE